MGDTARLAYAQAWEGAQKALQFGLAGQLEQADALLFRTRNSLKQLSGDLPIVGRASDLHSGDSTRPFATRSIDEARAWGWLELATGVLKMMQERPGASMMYLTRAWRIWRPWSNQQTYAEAQIEAKRERIRARLWLGEAWARSMSERATRVSQSLLRTALIEIGDLEAEDILQLTIEQQSRLPPASIGSPAYQSGQKQQTIPYICTLDPLQTKPFKPGAR